VSSELAPRDLPPVKTPAYLDLGKNLADLQWEKTTPDGITSEARYWIDDMYMITAVQVQAYRGDGRQQIHRPGRTHHGGLPWTSFSSPMAFSFTRPRLILTGAVARLGRRRHAELLRDLPANHPARGRILGVYRAMMASLLKYQGPDGLWLQLIDQPTRGRDIGDRQFTFALVTGVKNGWLDTRPMSLPSSAKLGSASSASST